MAENKTKPTNVSIDEFIASVENDRRRDDAMTVCKLMKDVTGE